MKTDTMFPFYLVRSASGGGGVISMHWDRDHAERKRDKLRARGMISHVVEQAEYLRLPNVSRAEPGAPARKRR